MVDKGREPLKMKRAIGLVGGVALVSGTMIGSGIFMSPQFVLSYVGSPGASLVIWAVAGVVAMLAALSYVELGTIIPESGGEFIYILRIYGSCPAFFAAVTFILVVKPFSAAAMGISIAEYAMAPVYPGCQPPQLAVKCTAAVAILIVATVNILNVRLAVRVQVVFLVAKVVALTVIVIGGLVEIIQGNNVIVENFKVENSFKGTHYSASGLGMAFFQGLWAYGGWYNLNCVTEELKKPEVNLPRALLIAISLVTGLYLLVNVSYLTVMTPNELMSSSAVAVTWGFTAWFFYGITLSGLIYLKIKKPELPRPYSVPIVLPILVLLVAIFLVLAPIIDDPQIEYLYVALFILSGAIIYVPFIHFKLCPGLLTKVTVFLQLFLEVAPADKNL
ncbi:b(0,+)-type amino acid transporter 1-like isoform X2 [Melanotaenia boesemani]|uniref:b(0,+)-type amino acid transporter 1-like isoform X2 n=1 Tax=Melanotaenia boesemani TaxID=1250792 RepID=UPI001C04FEFF|nr:b(0,+)-type amino acid transporter 1-like isoform X2 [Melanotaenia boesemani]